MKSIIQEDKKCYVCGQTYWLENHHIIYGTANRKKSEKHGLKVWLCTEHHRGTKGVHNNRELDLKFKRMAQEYFESHYGTRADFIIEFGRSYL